MDPLQPDPVPASRTEPIPIARPVAYSAAVALPPAPVRLPSPLHMLELTRRHAALDALLLLLVPIGAIYVPNVVAWLAAPPAVSDDGPAFDSAMLNLKWFEAALVVFLAIYFSYRGGVRAHSMGLASPRPLSVLGWGVAGLAGAYMLLLATIVVLYPFLVGPDEPEALRERMKFAEAFSDIQLRDFAVLLIAVVIHEELLFRGLLLPQLRRVTGSWTWAIVLSSAVFAMLHFVQGPIGMAQIFGVSIVFSIIFIFSRSLYAVMIAHYLFNFCQFAFMQLILPRTREMLDGIETVSAQAMNIASP